MSESVKQRTAAMSIGSDVRELRKLLEAAQADIQTLATAIDDRGAKLNADAGVTDTDYEEDIISSMTLDE